MLFPVACFAQRQSELSTSPQARSLSNIAFDYYQKGDYTKAIEYEGKALVIAEGVSAYLQCAISYGNLCTYYKSIGNITEAKYYINKALCYLDKSPDDAVYIHLMSELSDCYLQSGEYESALVLVNEMLPLLNEQTEEYSTFMLNLSNCYYYMGDYNKSIEILSDLLAKEENKSNNDWLFISSLLHNLAMSYQKMGKIRDAIWNEERSMQIKEDFWGNNHIKCAESMYFLGYLYLTVCNHDKATKLAENAARIIKRERGTLNIDYLDALRTLSLAYTDLKKKLETQQEILEILSIASWGQPNKYVYSCLNLAETYSKMDDKKKMEETVDLIRNNQNVQKFLEKDHRCYIQYLNRLAGCYFNLSDYEKAVAIGEEMLEKCKSIYGDNVGYYSDCIMTLYMIYTKAQKIDDSLKLLKNTRLFELLDSELKKNTSLLSYQNRISYWKQNSGIFCYFIPLIALGTNDDYFISLAYDISALKTKGYLLNYETNMSDLIKKHGDAAMKRLYDSYLSNRSLLSREYEESRKDSISKVLYEQEDRIWQNLKKQNLIERTDVTWRDIQENLNDEDIAIEFISSHDDKGTPYNMALLLRKNYSSPKLIYLENFPKIKKYSLKNETDSLFLTIWEPMMEDLDGVKNIYFSPSDMIYNTPIEYLADLKGQSMNERYNIYRLSSTQKLVDPRKVIKYETSVLYGGLNYEWEMSNSFAGRKNNHRQMQMDRGLELSLTNRSGFEPLPNTIKEVNEIAGILSKSNVSCVTYTGSDGIEESFKNLSEKRCNIIHIATHGMFVDLDTDNAFLSANNLGFIDDKRSFLYEEDAALARSFLVMSRGNGLSQHCVIPPGIDDGILTAQEIANIDLEGIDLVVLSACQSALGIINNEGVYGLQRGFKKAGANTILMSLDKVDDEATKILMVEFYRNLMDGKTKHQSLKDAQKFLRQVDNGKYDNPEYWASFIMLDGLN